MISNIINTLTGGVQNTQTGSNNCDCKSNNTSFDMVMISLLKAISTQSNQSIIRNIGTNSYNPNVPLGLDTITTVQNTNKVESTNSDKNINERIDSAIKSSSQKYGVNENLIRSIIKVESNFNPNATSPAGAKGLMQLMPSTYKNLGITNPYDIESNIDGGTKHIREFLNMYNGDEQMALMAYNGGCGRMLKRGVKSPSDIYKMPKETQNYVPKVMSYYKGKVV